MVPRIITNKNLKGFECICIPHFTVRPLVKIQCKQLSSEFSYMSCLTVSLGGVSEVHLCFSVRKLRQ